MELEVLDRNGKATGRKVTLNSEVFQVTPNDHAIYLDVKSIRANQRQGTHKSKQRNEISGSTKKLIKQKGTGGARKGSIKSPLLKGGGRVFGPEPRDYGFKLNKKTKVLARKSALTYKANENQILVLEDLNFETPKTKYFKELLSNLKISDKKSLLVLSDLNKNVYLSSRNLKEAKTIIASELNTYDILNSKYIVLTESSVSKIDTYLS
jgi:large subunit ribosomal protein L4